ncbi:hypothetical protein DV736_g5342, partial [Chaetothyriales sp. CBS 134916]
MASQRSDRLCRSAKSIKKTLGSTLKAVLKSLGSVLATGKPVGRRLDLDSAKRTVMPLDSSPSPETVSSGIKLTPPLYKCTAVKLGAGTLLTQRPDAYIALPFSRRCVFDINIRIQRQNNGSFGGKVARRVLLDTGADLNLIAASAHEDVGSPIDLHPAKLLSLGGRTFLEGKTELTFNFVGTGSLSTTKNTYTEVFAVIARNEQPLFDCILGAHWILRHWHDFTALMASKI